MSTEHRFWEYLRSLLSEVEHLHMTRVENAVVEGMPDVEGCYGGKQFWAELKVVSRPALSTTPLRPTIRPAQVAWARMREAAGGHVVMLLRVDGSNGASDIPYIYMLSDTSLWAEAAKGRTEAWWYANARWRSSVNGAALGRQLLLKCMTGD